MPAIALFHDQLVPAESVLLSAENRGFRYGDGFFETILFIDGQPKWWKYHADRIRRGAAVFRLTFPDDFFERLHTWLGQLLAANGLANGPARVRWQCWRQGKGLYTPLTTAASWVATAERQELFVNAEPSGHAVLADAVQTAPSMLSFLKGPNAALYALAGLEKLDRGADELILLSPRGFVAEATAAALIWLQGNTLYTPDPIGTGAVAGVRLAALSAQVANSGWRVRHVANRPNYLEAADAVATINVTGIRWLAAVEDRTYRPSPALDAFRALLPPV